MFTSSYSNCEADLLTGLQYDIQISKIPFPEMVKKATYLLSSKSQEKIHKKKWGFFQRLIGAFLKE
jgi:hypothetical protein